jgi:uncharacterized protein YbjQ (UPF0145 family)
MLITTTPDIEGKRIKEYLGIVAGEAVVGANLFRDLFAGIRDIVGGRAGAYEKELRKARDIAFEEIVEEAQELGANAVGSGYRLRGVGREERDADGKHQRHGRYRGMTFGPSGAGGV